MSECTQIPEEVLEEILGPAYNSRYMSIDIPLETDSPQSTTGLKRAPSTTPEFYVDNDYFRDLGDTPAWKTTHVNRKRLFARSVGTEDFFVGVEKVEKNDNVSSVSYEEEYVFVRDGIGSSTGERDGKDTLHEIRHETKQDNKFLFIDGQLSDNFRKKVVREKEEELRLKLLSGKFYYF